MCGGEHYDMSEFGLSIHRDKEKDTILIKNLKVKFKHLGTNGIETEFKYNLNNGRISIYNENVTQFDNKNWLKKEPKNIDFSDVDDIPENYEFYG